MAVKVLHDGEDLQTAVFGGRASNNVLAYMNQQIAQYSPYIKDDSFLMQSINKLKEFTSEAFQRGLDAVANMLNYNSISDSIAYLDSLGLFQQATPIMQRYIMAHVPLRELYLKGVLDGYEGSYTNVRGDAVGEDMYEWRRVNHGMISFVEKEVDNEIKTQWVSTTYYDKTPEGDRDLTFDQRCILKDTYEVIDQLLKDSDADLTSRLNNSR